MDDCYPPLKAPPHPQSRPRAGRGRGRGGPRRGGRNETSRQHPPAPTVLCCSVCTTGAPNYKCPKCRAIYCSIVCCRAHKQEHCAANRKQTEGDGATTEKNEKGSQVSAGSAAAATVRSKYLTVSELDKIRGEKRITKNIASSQELQPVAKRSRLGEDDDQRDNNDDNRHHPFDDLEPGWRMTDGMVNGMRSSSWLHQELADPGLQHLISQVVSTSSHVATGEKEGGHHSNRKQERLLDELKSSNPQFKLFLDKLLVTAGVLEVPEDQGKDFDLNAWLQSDSGSPQLQLKPLQRHPRPASTSSLLPNNEKDGPDKSSSSNSESEGSSSGDDNSSTSSNDP